MAFQEPAEPAFEEPEDEEDDSGSGEGHTLDVYLVNGQLADVRLDGESVHPTWFKIEWKENGELSAKVKGVRMATRYGDVISIHQGPPAG
jgi:hypothetical protein